MFLIPTRIKFK